MRHIFEIVALVLVFPGLCQARSLAASEVLDRYLNRPHYQQPVCSPLAFAVHIDASLPKLGKHGSMSGFRLVSQTGRIAYRGLQFSGDNVVKTNVIARFLANDMAPSAGIAAAGVTRQNYSLAYGKDADYNGLRAFVFRLKPKRKRVGLFNGELWLDAATAEPLRLWGDFVKSPSIFVRSFRFVLDYQSLDQCFQPFRLLLTVRTRIAGEAEMAVWMRSADYPAAALAGLDDVPQPTSGSED